MFDDDYSGYEDYSVDYGDPYEDMYGPGTSNNNYDNINHDYTYINEERNNASKDNIDIFKIIF